MVASEKEQDGTDMNRDNRDGKKAAKESRNPTKGEGVQSPEPDAMLEGGQADYGSAGQAEREEKDNDDDGSLDMGRDR